MAVKKKASKQVIVSTTKAKILQLHDCILNDLNEISLLYKKAVVENEKKLASVGKLFLKAKGSVVKAKKNKAKSPENYKAMESLLKSLSKESLLVKAEYIKLKEEHKVFLNHHKASMKMMKGLTTNAKTSSKIKRKVLLSNKLKAKKS